MQDSARRVSAPGAELAPALGGSGEFCEASELYATRDVNLDCLAAGAGRVAGGAVDAGGTERRWRSAIRTVREVIHNFNRDGFDALYPRYRGGRPRTFSLPQRQRIKKIALSVPTDLGQRFASWSLAKLADYLVAERVVDDISHEGLRQLLHQEGVSFQALRS